jgi:type II secretory pathway component PulF
LESTYPTWGFYDFAQMTFGIASVPTGLFLLVIAIGSVFRRIRRTRAVVVLTYLEQATRLNLPIPPFLAAAAAGERGRTARQLKQLQDYLADGHSIGTALAAAVPHLPERVYGVIHAAEKSGQLATTLQREVAEMQQLKQRSAERNHFVRTYLLLAVLFLWWYLSICFWFISPKIGEILRDFRMDTSPRTQAVLVVAQWVRDGRWFIFAVILIVLVLQLTPMLLEILAPRERKLLPLRKGWDLVLWYFPLTHLFVRDRGLGDVFTVMGAALEAGRPLPEAIQDAQGLQVNYMLDRQISRMSGAVMRGESLADAARHAALPVRAVAMISSAEYADSLPATCGFLARYYRGTFSRTILLARAATEPAMVVALGVVVYFVVRSVFDPLLQIYPTVDMPRAY